MSFKKHHPTTEEVAAAQALLSQLDHPNDMGNVALPEPLRALILDLIRLIAKNEPVTIIPSDAEISTQQAAEILGVSRPHLVKLLEEGAIPFRKVGRHRRMRLDDVLAYQKKTRKEALDKLQEFTQEMGLY